MGASKGHGSVNFSACALAAGGDAGHGGAGARCRRAAARVLPFGRGLAAGHQGSARKHRLGGTSIPNLLFLIHIDENVDYTAALEAGKHWQVALTAFAGPGIANVSLFLISRHLISQPWFRLRPVAANFMLWFVLMNLGNIYDYVPMRVFSDDGDAHNFIQDTGTKNSWVVSVVGSTSCPGGSWTSSGTRCRWGCTSATSSRQPHAV